MIKELSFASTGMPWGYKINIRNFRNIQNWALSKRMIHKS
jgi:hypothetical protein